jgi:hypothetical protein
MLVRNRLMFEFIDTTSPKDDCQSVKCAVLFRRRARHCQTMPRRHVVIYLPGLVISVKLCRRNRLWRRGNGEEQSK